MNMSRRNVLGSGIFTRAAEVVNKTQSAVSMQMKRLEERLERPIFARDGRASKLTEDGQRLLDYARRIVDIISTSGEGSVIEDIPFDRLEPQSLAQQPVGAGRPATGAEARSVAIALAS